MILLLYQWQPCSTNKPTIIGFENWHMRGSCISSYGRYCGRGVCDGITLSVEQYRGIDLDRVSQVRARQDGKTLDKISNTKFAVQLIEGWLPLRSIDPDFQHEITHLRSQLAELHQRLGDDPSDVSTPPRTGQQSSSSQATPIQRALMGSGAPAPPPAFDPACILTTPRLSNVWLTDNLPSGLADRTFLVSNIAKADAWWSNQPADAVETVQKVASALVATLWSKELFLCTEHIRDLNSSLICAVWQVSPAKNSTACLLRF